MMWFYLSISKFFNKIGNYFYNLHVVELRIKQKKDSEKPNKPYCKKCVLKYATTELLLEVAAALMVKVNLLEE